MTCHGETGESLSPLFVSSLELGLGQRCHRGMSTTWKVPLGAFSFSVAACAVMAPMDVEAEAMRVYFGTYTGARSQGIYVSAFDSETGALSDPQLAAATPSPSFLALHPSGRFLYAANEVEEFQGQKAGSVT